MMSRSARRTGRIVSGSNEAFSARQPMWSATSFCCRDSLDPLGHAVKVTPAATCRVTFPRPVLESFTYAVPGSLAQLLRPGMRVQVQFGRRPAIGLVESVAPADSDGESTGETRLRPVLEALDDEPVLNASLLRLCRWVAD
ncbi:MAG: hypothetical protein ACE5FP_07220, partial [Gemmatimonadota bacterium]